MLYACLHRATVASDGRVRAIIRQGNIKSAVLKQEGASRQKINRGDDPGYN
jgi:hypothetical protein